MPSRTLGFFGVLGAMAACGEAYTEALESGGADAGGAGDGGTMLSDGGAGQTDVTNPDGATGTDLSPLLNQCPLTPFESSCTPMPNGCQLDLIANPRLTYPWGIATDTDNVYWVTQAYQNGVANQPGYEGTGVAEIWRRAKRPTDDAGATAVLLAGDQQAATAIALDQTSVYWATWQAQGADRLMTVRRVPRDCAGRCVPENVLEQSALERVTRMFPFPGGFVMLHSDGKMGRLDVVAKTYELIPNGVATTGTTMTVIAGDQIVYGRPSLLQLNILTATNSQPQPIALPDIDASPSRGVTLVGNGCDEVFAARPDFALWRAGRVQFPVEKVAELPLGTPADIAVDDRFIYVAGAGEENGRLLAISRKGTGAATTVWNSEVRNVVVDADGVYWGNHHIERPGAVYMMRKR